MRHRGFSSFTPDSWDLDQIGNQLQGQPEIHGSGHAGDPVFLGGAKIIHHQQLGDYLDHDRRAFKDQDIYEDDRPGEFFLCVL